MSLYQKLILFMLGATVVPLAVVGFALVRSAEDALQARIRKAQVETARSEARAAALVIEEEIDDLRRAAHTFDLTGASKEELTGALRVLYQAAPDVAITLLVDPEGKLEAPPVFLEDPDRIPELADHPPRSAAAVQRLEAVLPLERAAAEGVGAVVLSQPYLVAQGGEVAFSVALPVATSERGLLVFAAELSLGSLQAHLAEVSALGAVMVVDAGGRIVVHPNPARLREAIGLRGLEGRLPAGEAASLDLLDGEAVLLGAVAPVPVKGLGWTVVVAMPRTAAFASVAHLRWTVLGASGITVLLLLFLGWRFTGGIGRALKTVQAGAEAFGRGDLRHRIEPPNEEELRALAESFNAMGEELFAARKKLERWNEELQAEVEARTRELREAQARLLQAQKLAAVGQLGAGVAHEINNPLAGILGNVQLLLMKRRKGGADEKEIATLERMEEAARRCRDITQTLLKFSQQGEGRLELVEVEALVREATEAARSRCEAAGLKVETWVEADLPAVRADFGQLTSALLHLLSNAEIAAGDGAGTRVRVSARRDGSEIVLCVEDDGIGIPEANLDRIFEPFFTTKRRWNSLGLGLAVTYRIVEAHDGRIDVESREGEGTRIFVRLPVAS